MRQKSKFNSILDLDYFLYSLKRLQICTVLASNGQFASLNICNNLHVSNKSISNCLNDALIARNLTGRTLIGIAQHSYHKIEINVLLFENTTKKAQWIGKTLQKICWNILE